MADEGKGVALAILGIVAVIAVVGLIMLFTGATGKYAASGNKLYGGGGITHGQDQYNDPEGYVRYATPRPYEFEEGEQPQRIAYTGGAPVPDVMYDVSNKRTGPIKNNPCPYAPYSDRVTPLYASGRDCVGSETPGFEDYLCCA